MRRWVNYLLALALTAVLATITASLADLGLRQLRYDNCLRQLEALNLRRVHHRRRSKGQNPEQGIETKPQPVSAGGRGYCSKG